MKSKIESGAKRRAVVGASAGSRREVASVGREIEREEIVSGYAVMLGRGYEDDGERYTEYLNAVNGDTCRYASESVITDYADACEKCAELVREKFGNGIEFDYPPPEFPRVVFVRLSASVMGVA